MRGRCDRDDGAPCERRESAYFQRFLHRKDPPAESNCDAVNPTASSSYAWGPPLRDGCLVNATIL
jgi:hypothetical protein